MSVAKILTSSYNSCIAVKNFQSATWMPFMYSININGNAVLEEYWVRGYKSNYFSGTGYYLYADSRGYYCGTDGLAGNKKTFASTDTNKFVNVNEVCNIPIKSERFMHRTSLYISSDSSSNFRKIAGNPKYIYMWASNPVLCPNRSFSRYGLDNWDGSEIYGQTESLFITAGVDYDIFLKFKILNPNNFSIGAYSYTQDFGHIYGDYYAFAIESDKSPNRYNDTIDNIRIEYNDYAQGYDMFGEESIYTVLFDDSFCGSMALLWGNVDNLESGGNDTNLIPVFSKEYII